MIKRLMTLLTVMCFTLNFVSGIACAYLNDNVLSNYAKKNDLKIETLETENAYGDKDRKDFIVFGKCTTMRYNIWGDAKGELEIMGYCSQNKLINYLIIKFPSDTMVKPKYLSVLQPDGTTRMIFLKDNNYSQWMTWGRVHWYSNRVSSEDLYSSDIKALKNATAIAVKADSLYPLIKKNNTDDIKKIKEAMEHIEKVKAME